MGPQNVPWVPQPGCSGSTGHPLVALQDQSLRIAANVPHPRCSTAPRLFPKTNGASMGSGGCSPHPTHPEAIGMWGSSISVLTHHSPREEQWGHRLQRFHGSAPSSPGTAQPFPPAGAEGADPDGKLRGISLLLLLLLLLFNSQGRGIYGPSLLIIRHSQIKMIDFRASFTAALGGY